MKANSFPFRNRRPRRWLFALLMLICLLALGAVVQALWNGILPQVMAVHPLSYLQALGLLLLSRILFGRLGFGGRGGRFRGGPQGKFGLAGRHMREKWQHMSEEERQRFRNEFRERCRRRKGEA